MSIFSEDNVPQFKPKGATHQELLLYKALQALAAIANTAPAGPGVPPSAGLATVVKQDEIIAALAGIDTINSSLALDVHVDDLEQLTTDGNATLVLIKTAVEALSAATPAADSVLQTLKTKANDLKKVFAYYTSTGGGDNPSGNKNILTITYSSVLLGTSATETFKWDIDDDVTEIQVS